MLTQRRKQKATLNPCHQTTKSYLDDPVVKSPCDLAVFRDGLDSKSRAPRDLYQPMKISDMRTRVGTTSPTCYLAQSLF